MVASRSTRRTVACWVATAGVLATIGGCPVGAAAAATTAVGSHVPFRTSSSTPRQRHQLRQLRQPQQQQHLQPQLPQQQQQHRVHHRAAKKEDDEKDNGSKDNDDNEDKAKKTSKPTDTPLWPTMPPTSFSYFDNSGSSTRTEDDETDTTNKDAGTSDTSDNITWEAACRAASRGVPVTTGNHVQAVYEYELTVKIQDDGSSAAVDDALAAGIALNQRITHVLEQRYILDHCPPRRRRQQQQRRQLLEAGDVRGVERGFTAIKALECSVAPPDNRDKPDSVQCFTLQSSNTLHFRSDYNTNDNDDFENVLENVANVFSSIGESDTLERVQYIGGSAGAVSSSNGGGGDDELKSGNGGGRSGVAKFFLTLFLILLLGALGYAGYKYAYPWAREAYDTRRVQTWQKRQHKSVGDGDSTKSNDSGGGDSRHGEDHRNSNIILTDTMDANSLTDMGMGCEMILDDLDRSNPERTQQQQQHSNTRTRASPTSVNVRRFSPGTLPKSKEKQRTNDMSCYSYNPDQNYDNKIVNGDSSFCYSDFSFSDVNVIIQDDDLTHEESITGIRPYKCCDTVDL